MPVKVKMEAALKRATFKAGRGSAPNPRDIYKQDDVERREAAGGGYSPVKFPLASIKPKRSAARGTRRQRAGSIFIAIRPQAAPD